MAAVLPFFSAFSNVAGRAQLIKTLANGEKTKRTLTDDSVFVFIANNAQSVGVWYLHIIYDHMTER